MKNKVIALLVVLLFVFTGCGSVQADYWNKMKEVAKWEGTEVEQTGNVVIDLMGEQINASFKTTGIMNQKTMSGHMAIEMTMEMPASLTTEMVNPETINYTMEMYIDNGKVYFNKSYFEQIALLTGMPLSEQIEKLDVQYIGIKESNDMATQMLAMMGDKAQVDEMYKLYEEVGKLLGVDVAITKEGNTYTIALNKEELISVIKVLMNSIVTNMEQLNTKFSLALTKEDIATLQEQYQVEKESIDAQIDQIAMFVDGNITWASTFEKNKQTDKLVFKAGMAEEMAQMMGGNLSMEMTLDQTSKKVAPKAIELPGKTIELTQEEFNTLFGIPQEAIPAEKLTPEAVNNKDGK